MAKPWEKYQGQQQGGGGVFTLPPSQREQAAINAERERIRLAQEASDRAANAETRANDAMQRDWAAKVAQMEKDGFVYSPQDGRFVRDPTFRAPLPADKRSELETSLSATNDMSRRVAELRKQYKANFEGGFPFQSLAETFAPDNWRPENGTFNDLAGSLLSDMAKAKGLTAQQFNTPAEQRMFFEPMIPKASDNDARIVQKLNELDALINSGRTNMAKQLGIDPSDPRLSQSGQPGGPQFSMNGQPVSAEDLAARVWDTTYTRDTERQAAPTLTDTTLDAMPPAMAAEYQAYIQQNAGRIDPGAYGKFVGELARKYNLNPSPGLEAAHAAYAREMNAAYKQGQRTFDTPGVERKLSLLESGKNALINNPVGATAVGAVDGLTGAASFLDPQGVQALASKDGYNQAGYITGQVGGAIAGTKGIGAVAGRGANALAKITPELVAKMRAASPFMKNLATDIAYGTANNAVREGDPLSGAAFGGLGSIGGQVVGKGLGAAVGGVRASPMARYLEKQGVPLTVGQTMGGAAKRLEDSMTSWPLVGDMIQRRQEDAFRGFNEAAFRQAGEPIGATTSKIGDDGITVLRDQAGQAYDNATAGVDVPLDPQFMNDLRGIAPGAQMLPPRLQPEFASAMDNSIGPIAQAGRMTGEGYQQAVRGLKGYRAELQKPGHEQAYRDLLTKAQDAFTGQMTRAGGDSVVQGLATADKAYRRIKTVQDAVNRAGGGTATGQSGVFTPFQLLQAVRKTDAKFPGDTGLKKLARTGQNTLPSKIPDSGTAMRLLVNAGGLGALGGGGYLAGVDPSDPAAQKGALATAALILGGTKVGQKALKATMFKRPGAAKQLGSAIRAGQKKGIFGAAAIPLLIENQN